MGDQIPMWVNELIIIHHLSCYLVSYNLYYPPHHQFCPSTKCQFTSWRFF